MNTNADSYDTALHAGEKRITLNNNTLIYESKNPCTCWQGQTKTQSVIICEPSNTTVYVCSLCTLKNVSTTKHLYIYPDSNETDYEPFYVCPILEPAQTLPIKSQTLSCPCCYKINTNSKTQGHQWMCHSCHTSRLIPLGMNNSHYMPKKPSWICSGLIWQCVSVEKHKYPFFKTPYE